MASEGLSEAGIINEERKKRGGGGGGCKEVKNSLGREKTLDKTWGGLGLCKLEKPSQMKPSKKKTVM